MQEYKTTTIQLRSFIEKTLTYPDEIALQTLVVNLPSREMPKMPRKSFLQQVHLTQNMKYPSRAQKIRSH
jgi:hypothetical protein